MSTKARTWAPGSRSTCPHSLTRCARSTDSNWRAWPKLNSRSKVPIVEGAYTPPNRAAVPPLRTTSTSSILSAPAHIPATSVASFGAGFAAPDLTLRLGNVNLLRQQLHQAGPRGQRHHRHQARARHEIVVVEHN